MIRAITERRQLGNQEKLYSRMKSSKSALDSTNHLLVSMMSKKSNTGLHSFKKKLTPTSLKLKKKPRSLLKLKLLKKQNLLLKLRLPKPKLRKKPRMLSQ
jgi:hypothetical protein